MSDTFHEHLARQCAVGREKFGPGVRTKGVMEHIKQEFDEILTAESLEEAAEEWTDVVILAMDGHLRAVREKLREQMGGAEGVQVDPAGNVIGWNGEPTNDFVAAVALRLIRQKQGKNELRDFANWRDASEDEAINHKEGVHD